MSPPPRRASPDTAMCRELRNDPETRTDRHPPWLGPRFELLKRLSSTDPKAEPVGKGQPHAHLRPDPEVETRISGDAAGE